MGVLGPHEGRELELMLNHQKEIALFYTDSEVPEHFFPYLEDKTFQLQTINLKTSLGDFSYYLIYRPEHIEKAEELSSVLLKSYDKFDPDLERKIGKLLGYSDDDIEFYINHWLKST
ncbi:hemocin immunity protein [Rodentibacter caecimuris]|uniref:hemocin immunity protein n=1 Tax=Rodentibacter caecimuris TaxID=1796644 RepID=UPI001094D0C0|nr:MULTISPECIES: hemocin immunity protein [Pasteurellaceae]MCQ9124614.1 hemocin immunity protein [Rodentibacter heylii]MCR1837421.1 hemocin immunity protein [Pasteurella caecimuris]MCU0108078.1 hemocin immunity protein [Pasteurella caecimuris]TGY49692.1 hemocin immunity protein [Pasteurella caecimuris]